MTPEGKAKSSVSKALSLLEQTGDIYWYERLNSGVVNTGTHYIHNCRPGTFDFVAVFPNTSNGLALAFIEVKRDDIKAFLSESQKKFKSQYDGKHVDIHFWLVQSGKEVKKLIMDHCYNRLNEIDL